MFAATSPVVSLPAETVFHLGPFAITNSMLLGLLGTGILLAILWHTRSRVLKGQHTKLSLAVLWGYEALVNTTAEVLGTGGTALARRIAPLGITMFFVIIINNWSGLLPVVGSVTWHGEPLLRGLAADLNFTLALALITIVTAQAWAVKKLGVRGSLGRYFGNPLKDPLHAFVGFLELIAEFSRLIALAMRLFGNVFGGEVLLVVIAYIAGYAAPLALPVFMGLELFVGAIQAYIFFMLTVAFIALSINAEPHGQEDGETAPAH